MKIFFRVDSSAMIGSGHLFRCLTLAQELRNSGHIVRFLTKDMPTGLHRLIGENGFALSLLPPPKFTEKPFFHENYSEWLGVEQEVDAHDTLSAFEGLTPDWLIVDHYGVDLKWEKIVKPHVRRLMVIDDLANRQHCCDLIVDQNFSEMQNRYKNLVNDSAYFAMGPHFAMINSEYRKLRSTKKRDGAVNRILVFLGGSDPHNVTETVLDLLLEPAFSAINLDLVIGLNHKKFSQISLKARERPLTTVYSNLPNLAELMLTADLAIGGGGVTTWERICMCLPSIVVILSENQKFSCEALASSGYIISAGPSALIKPQELRGLIEKCVNSPELMTSISNRAAHLVDGRGTLRITELLEKL